MFLSDSDWRDELCDAEVVCFSSSTGWQSRISSEVSCRLAESQGDHILSAATNKPEWAG